MKVARRLEVSRSGHQGKQWLADDRTHVDGDTREKFANARQHEFGRFPAVRDQVLMITPLAVVSVSRCRSVVAGRCDRSRPRVFPEDLRDVFVDLLGPLLRLGVLMDRKNKEGNPWFCYFNTTRMHIWTHLKAASMGKTGLGTYPDGMTRRKTSRLPRPCVRSRPIAS